MTLQFGARAGKRAFALVGREQGGAAGSEEHEPRIGGQMQSHEDRKGKQRGSKRFRYGNFAAYYSHRTDLGSTGELVSDSRDFDPRLSMLKAEWFEGKRVLDIGCNAGVLTLAIAKHFHPRMICGVDIDGDLIRKACRNQTLELSVQSPFPSSLISSSSSSALSSKSISKSTNESSSKGENAMLPNQTISTKPSKPTNQSQKTLKTHTTVGSYFPISFRMAFGPIPMLAVRASTSPAESLIYPLNTTFAEMDFVNEQTMPSTVGADKFDCICCFSTTKWIHLNWGDEGIKTLFQKVYRFLKSKGVFLLEPQPFSTYSKRAKNFTKEDFENIKLLPEMFSEYLIQTVGFSEREVIYEQDSDSLSSGFNRPIYLFRKK